MFPPMQVNTSLAPLGADRFYALVKDGFFQDSAFLRFIPDVGLHFGISSNFTMNRRWLHNKILDDPVMGNTKKGTVAFLAADGPNTRTSQVFINFHDNPHIKTNYGSKQWFGKVVSGLEVAEAVFDPIPGGDPGGLDNLGDIDQDKYEQLGNSWIREKFPGINFITNAYIREQEKATIATNH